jgi:glycosyltransferase involved in cell wall biosynthesis
LIGGVEKYLQSVIPSLLERGHSVGLLYEHVFHPDKDTIDPPAAGLPSWCIGETGREACLLSLEKWNPDVVYSHGLDDGLESALLERFSCMFYAHTYWGTCVSGRKCHLSPRPQPCARRLGPACLLMYYPRRCGGLHPGTMWRMFQEQSRRNSNLDAYQAVLVASHHMYQELERHGVPKDRLHLVPLPPPDVAPTLPPPARNMQGRILFLGRLMDIKGVDYLLESLPQASQKLGRPLTVTIAGDGPDRGKLEKLAAQLGVAAEFPGWVAPEQKLNLLRQSDLLAIPSLWPEPFGLVGIEAGSFGVPAVGYSVGGIPDWLIPGRSGELAPGQPPTIHGLADAIVRALADAGHYQKLCMGAWEVARSFSLERHVDNLETILAPEYPRTSTPVLSRPN